MRRGEDETRERIVLLYDRYLPAVYGYARNRLQAADAEDIAAEVFRTALQKLQAEPDIALSKGWFLTVTRNLVIDRWRRDFRWDGRLEVLARDAAALAHPATADEDRVLDALDRLEPDHRAVLMLRYVDRFRTREIAEMIGRNPRAVDSLIARARRALLQAFEDAAV